MVRIVNDDWGIQICVENRPALDLDSIDELKDIRDAIDDFLCNQNDGSVKSVIDYLNAICGTKFRPNSAATIRKIKSRLKEKFTVEQMKAVIDSRAKAWLNDPKMSEYLRPETLFGTKFESYLQIAVKTFVKIEEEVEESEPPIIQNIVAEKARRLRTDAEHFADFPEDKRLEKEYPNPSHPIHAMIRELRTAREYPKSETSTRSAS